jgi:hypothetical protein
MFIISAVAATTVFTAFAAKTSWRIQGRTCRHRSLGRIRGSTFWFIKAVATPANFRTECVAGGTIKALPVAQRSQNELRKVQLVVRLAAATTESVAAAASAHAIAVAASECVSTGKLGGHLDQMKAVISCYAVIQE